MDTRQLLTAYHGAGDHGANGLFADRTLDPWRARSLVRSVIAITSKFGRRLAFRWRRQAAGEGVATLSGSGSFARGERPLWRHVGSGVAPAPVRGHERPGERANAGHSAPTPRSAATGEDVAPRTPGRERLEAIDARIRVSRTNGQVSAGYLTFANETSSTATVVALESPAFERVEMHERVTCGERATSRRIDSLEVLAGESVTFSPGERQLALIGARQALVGGQLVGITLIFSSGRKRVLPFRVVVDGDRDPRSTHDAMIEGIFTAVPPASGDDPFHARKPLPVPHDPPSAAWRAMSRGHRSDAGRHDSGTRR